MRVRDENKAAQIYDATLQLVLAKGLAGVTMCDICKSAGIATGTLYIYFRNKEELMYDLFRSCRKESADFYFKDYNPEEGFEEGFRKIWSNIITYRLLYFERFVFLEQCYHSPFISDTVRKNSLKALDPLFHLLEKGKEQGLVKPIDNNLLSGFIFGAVNEVVKKAHYNNKKIDQKTQDDLYQLCCDGLSIGNRQ